MPHSLRAKLSGLRYKGILEDKDYKRLCKALDNENVLGQIRAEIEQYEVECILIMPTNEQTCNRCTIDTFKDIYQIIDNYTK